MLKQRVLTALILAPLAIWATLALPSDWFALILAGIFTLGAWEWSRLADFKFSGRLVYLALLVMGFALYFRLPLFELRIFIAVALLWWLAVLVQVWRFPNGDHFWRDSRAARAAAGLLILLPSWAALVAIHRELDPKLVLLLLVLVWGADIGAYFAGRRFGRHKLAPQVSPGKTWEGLGGALAVTIPLAFGAASAFGAPREAYLPFVLVCVGAVLISVLGDLAESLFKRIAGAKDSGGLLPGHGGIMDRIDSLTAAAPLFAAGLFWWVLG